MTTYKTFVRRASNWEEFSNARKITRDRGLTADEARRACEAYNSERTDSQIAQGIKLEFEAE